MKDDPLSTTTPKAQIADLTGPITITVTSEAVFGGASYTYELIGTPNATQTSATWDSAGTCKAAGLC